MPLGPVTFLLLAKPDQDATAGFNPLRLIEPLLEAYTSLLGELHDQAIRRAAANIGQDRFIRFTVHLRR